MAQAKNGEWLRKVLDRYKYVAMVILIGVVLLLIPTGTSKSGTETTENRQQLSAEAERTLEDTEARMQEILGKIDGVGKLELMLTVESSTEQRLAQNTELSYSGDTAAPEDYSRRSETVILSGDSGEEPLITSTLGPVYRGALVVCEGGNRAEVKLAVTQAVAALTGLSSDRISVVQCQS